MYQKTHVIARSEATWQSRSKIIRFLLHFGEFGTACTKIATAFGLAMTVEIDSFCNHMHCATGRGAQRMPVFDAARDELSADTACQTAIC